MIVFKQNKPLKDYDSVSLAARLRDHFVVHYPLADVQRLEDAVQVASYLHRSDVRRGGRGKMPNPPYIEHPLRVAVRMAAHFSVTSPDALIAGVLHDTVEDHPFEFSEFEGVSPTLNEYDARDKALNFISTRFGYKVADTVSFVSNPIMPEGSSKAERVASYQAHVASVVPRSEAALIVKVSDFVDNAGSLHHHYDPGDPKVTYFLDRYEPLLSIYEEALVNRGESNTALFSPGRAVDRLKLVRDSFQRLRGA